MVAKVVAVVTVLCMIFFSGWVPDPQIMAIFVGGMGGLFLVLVGLLGLLPLTALHRAEMKITPRVMEMYQKYFRWRGTVFALFSVVSFVLFFVFMAPEEKAYYLVFVALWVLFLGIAIDLFMDVLHAAAELLSPFDVIKMYGEGAESVEKQGDHAETCTWIGALAETGTKAIENESTVLGTYVIHEMRQLGKNCLEWWKDHLAEDKEAARDQIYPIHFMIQRLEFLFDHALARENEPVCMAIITSLSQFIVVATRCRIEISGFCIRALKSCVDVAQDEDFDDIVVKASCALEEVVKEIAVEPEVGSLEVRETFIAIIDQMETLAKGMFQRDKTINIEALSQSFYKIRELLQNEPMASHPDQSPILAEVNRVVGEFVALQQVMAGKKRFKGEKGEGEN